MKVLTFVIPAYNSEGFLAKCIDSMLAPQILEKLEILVVNDGSTDATAAVAERYCARYPGVVRLISQENRGHGGALNTGCAAAQGKYLKVIDADDWVETGNLPAFVALLEQCESDVVLTHHHTVDVGTGQIRDWKCYPAEFGRACAWEEIMSDWRGFEHSLTFHGITYRSAFYSAYGIRLSEQVFYEDHEFATYPCCHAGSVTAFDLFIYHYRIGDVNQSVSEANQLKRIGHIRTVLRRMTQEYRQLPETAGKRYAAMKLQGLLLRFLTTALLVHPDRKAGRQLAAQCMAECAEAAPAVCSMAKRKYQIFSLMSRLHIRKGTWDKFLDSRFYALLRGKRTDR